MSRAPDPTASFQELVAVLLDYWAGQACVIEQGYDVEVGAGTFHPSTFLRALGPEPWRSAYVQPSRRPGDGRYGENPNRLQRHYQLQVFLKPSPEHVQEIYLDSLRHLGIDLQANDLRFVEDNWESPTLGAWGLGWEVWLNGMEVTQFTYFQQAGGMDCRPVAAELTYGLERIAMYLQDAEDIFELAWARSDLGAIRYGELHRQAEAETSAYNFEQADTAILSRWFQDCERECLRLAERELPLPAYEQALRASHLFNLLEARRVLSVTERMRHMRRVRHLARAAAGAWLESRRRQGFPLLRPADAAT